MRDRGRVHRIVDRIYEAALEPASWEPLLGELASGVGSPSAGMLVRWADPRLDPGAFRASGIDLHYRESYFHRHHAFDPVMPEASRLPVGSVFDDTPYMQSADPARRDVFVREWLEPQGFARATGIVLRDGSPWKSLLFFLRSRRQRGPGEPEWGMLSSLVPHLTRAISVQDAIGGADARGSALAEIVDRLPLGVVVLDRSGRVLSTNLAGEQILAARDGLCVRERYLRGTDVNDAKALARAIADATGAGAGAPASASGVTIRRSEGRAALVVLVTPAHCTGASGMPSRSAAIALVQDPDRCLRPRAGTLARLYELTPAQAELATRIADGVAPQALADELGLSIITVRDRLKQVFARTGTSRQAELVRLILSGPGMMDAR